MPKTNNTHQSAYKFQGFSSPNFTIVPDEVFDELMPILSGAELKVLLYIIRRTFGFKKDSDNISLNQICKGITRKDGEVLDHGTGLSQSTAQLAIKGLVEKDIIVATRRQSAEKGYEPTTYSLRILDPFTENRQRGGAKIGEALHRKSVTQYTVLQQTDTQDINTSKDKKREIKHYVNKNNYRQLDADDIPPLEPSNGAKRRGRPRKLAEGDGEEQGTSRNRNIEKHHGPKITPPPGTQQQVLPIGDTLMQRYASFVAPPTEDEQWHDLKSFFYRGFSIELRDEANITSTVTRAYNLFKRKQEQHPDFDFGAFVSLMYEAKSITQDRSGSIKKTNEHGFTTKMAYFFAVLEDKLGFKKKRTKAD